MVRNVGGGDKMKHMARKHINGSKNAQSKILRTSLCDDEKYGYVIKICGNGMCVVKCIDGYERLCFIRGKFSGRSKRENTIASGTWVLVGLRQWDAEKEFASKQTKTGKSVQKCDLLEIYTSAEREKLRVQEKIFQELSSENSDDEFQSCSKQTVEFKDQETLEYQEIVEQGGKLSRMKKSSYNDIYDNISGDSDDDNDSGDNSDDNSDDSGSDDAQPKKQQQQQQPQQPQQQTQSQKKAFEFQSKEIDIDDI
jgi:translation initiation factor IF-1